MANHKLCFDPIIGPYGYHDPAAAIFEDGELIFATEEERYIRKKHASNRFPKNAINACLDHANLELEEIDELIIPYDPTLITKRFATDVTKAVRSNAHPAMRVWDTIKWIKHHLGARVAPNIQVTDQLREVGTPPTIKHREHHRCHAASAFHPTDFEEALVLTIDGRGEYDSTVVWQANQDGLNRVHTYEYPNSLGHFFGAVTEYLGFRAFNGEGKIMGLAPYGNPSEDIERIFRSEADFGVDYDVTGLLSNGKDTNPSQLEELFDRPKKEDGDGFTQFEKDFAYTAQSLLEETISAIVKKNLSEMKTNNVGLAGGVALNCKANKRVMEMNCVDEIFIQPVANDAGLALGGGWLESPPEDIEPMTSVYFGYDVHDDDIEGKFRNNKIQFEQVTNIEEFTAERLANGELVGWVQGRMEMGPRALGNRSIIADPRTEASRDRVNKYVKHREEWRPFAPSMLEEAVDEYLVNAERSSYMIKTFDTKPEKQEDLKAVIHPGDGTTRPQTLQEHQNPRYYQLIKEFEKITDVPVLLNTSFNDHGEPIIRTSEEALRDFFGMGLDILVIGDYVIGKNV